MAQPPPDGTRKETQGGPVSGDGTSSHLRASVPALGQTQLLPCGVPSPSPSTWDRIGAQPVCQTGLAQGWAPLAFLELTLTVVKDSLQWKL